MSATSVPHELTVPDEVARAVILPDSYTDLEGVVHPACRWLRANRPIGLAHVEGYDPVWVISRHADIRFVLNNAETFHNGDVNTMLQPKAGDAFLRDLLGGTTRVLDGHLSYIEPPKHTAYRAATDFAFTPKGIRVFEERLREIARAQVDSLLEHGGECDFVQAVSARFPLHSVLELLGVPESDYDRMLELTQHTFGGDDPDWRRDDVPPTPEAMARQWLESVQDFYEYFEDVRKDRLACPRTDLASQIVHAKLDNGDLLPERVQNHMTAGVAIAGHDTTNSSIAAGMHGLATFPEQFARVKADLSLVPRLVEESLRWATPAKHFMRNATRATAVAGVEMQAMDRQMCLFISGNFDEEVFPDPYAFDVTRRPNPHLSFSHGPHICQGLHIARYEMRVLFEELIPRLASVELAAAPRLKRGNFVTGFKTLPIRFRAS